MSKGNRGRMKLKNTRGYLSQKLKVGSMKNQVKERAINLVQSNDDKKNSLDRNSSNKSKALAYPSMLQKASRKEKKKKYNHCSGSMMDRRGRILLKKSFPPISSTPDEAFRISAVEGVYSPKIDHLFIDFVDEELFEFPNNCKKEIPKFFKPHSLDLKKL